MIKRFGTDKRDKVENPDFKLIPGPGNYSIGEDAGKGAPKFSFGKELRGDERRPMTPGPGTYQYKTYVGKDAPKITISARPQTSLSRTMDPGPGQYNSTILHRPKSPSYRIGTARRDGDNKILAAYPGPGQYSPTVVMGSNRPKSPLWSMGKGQRTNLSPFESVPGPGNYNVSKGLGEGPKVISIKLYFLVFY